MTNRIELDNGKYTVVNDLHTGGNLHALRHGEEWRNLNGDNLVLAMYHEIESLRNEARIQEEALKDIAQDITDYHGQHYALIALKALEAIQND